MSEPTAVDILKAARAKIADPLDWGKGENDTRDDPDTFCAVEAIEEIALMTPERKQAQRALCSAAGIPENGLTLCDWNDAPERTHAEVLAAFDLAIATLRM